MEQSLEWLEWKSEYSSLKQKQKQKTQQLKVDWEERRKKGETAGYKGDCHYGESESVYFRTQNS